MTVNKRCIIAINLRGRGGARRGPNDFRGRGAWRPGDLADPAGQPSPTHPEKRPARTEPGIGYISHTHGDELQGGRDGETTTEGDGDRRLGVMSGVPEKAGTGLLRGLLSRGRIILQGLPGGGGFRAGIREYRP